MRYALILPRYDNSCHQARVTQEQETDFRSDEGKKDSWNLWRSRYSSGKPSEEKKTKDANEEEECESKNEENSR